MQTPQSRTSYRQYIQREFHARVMRNRGYSLRAFARDIGIAAPKLSQVLNGTCGLSGTSAKALARRLRLSDAESEYFVTLVEAEHSRSRAGKAEAKMRVRDIELSRSDELDLERFSIIADWYHFAILELTDLPTFRSSPEWIAERLGITKEAAKQAVARLLDHGLLRSDERGRLQQTHAHLATPGGVPSRELRNHHSQILQKADQALDNVPLTERDFSSTTLSIDSSKIEEARKTLVEFRRKFCKEIQAEGSKDRVYCLAIQFFPLDRAETKTPRRDMQ